MFRKNLADTSVNEIMGRWPATVPVFVRHRMRCPGCLLAPFMTLAEAAMEHGVDFDTLLDELARAIEPMATREGSAG